jgi:O-antigen ligase/tetratricopeptide (TPR) repeat protein
MTKKRRNDGKTAAPFLWVINACVVLALLTVFLQSPVAGIRMTFYKALAFQAVSLVMFASWIALAVAHKGYRPRRSPVIVSVIVYLSALLLTLFAAQDAQLSFWSTEVRMTGIVFVMHCVAWFLVLSSVFRTRKEWRSVLGLITAVSTVMAVIGIAQSAMSGFSGAAIGALGNQSYFAAFLLVTAFIAGYLRIGSSGRARQLLGLSFALQILAIMLTGSRGALVTLGVCLVAGVIGFTLSSNIRSGKKFLMVVVTAMLLSAVVGGFIWMRSPSGRAWSENAPLPYFVKRTALKNFGEDRIVLWDIAVKGIAEKPIFGHGGGQFEAVFSRYYDPYGPGQSVFHERWFDKAHNQYLDSMIEFGLVGTVPFIIIWMVVLFGLARAFMRTDSLREKQKLTMLVLSIFGYLVYSVFIFDTTSQLIVLYALLAYLVIVLRESSGGMDMELESAPVRNARKLSKRVVVFLVPVALVGAWFMDIRPMVAASRLHQANQLMKTNRSAAVEELPHALSGFNPYVYGFRLKSISAIIPFAESVHVVSDQMESLLRVLASESAKNAEARPTDIRSVLSAAVMHRLLGEYSSEELDKAEKYATEAEKIAPGNQAVYQEQAEIELLRGNTDKAIELLHKSLSMVFNSQQTHKGVVHFRLSCAYAMKGDLEEMYRHLDLANGYGFRSQHDVRLAISLDDNVVDGADYDGLYEYLDGNLKSYPDHPRLIIPAARIYAANGDSERAEEMIGRLRARGDDAAADMLADELFPSDEN